MIRHVVLMTWKESAERSDIQKVNDAFSAIEAKIPEIKSLSFGEDAGIFPGNANYALIMDFDNADDFKTYVAHQAHTELLQSISGPILESFSTTQFEI